MVGFLHNFVGILAPFVLLLVFMITMVHVCQTYTGTYKRILIFSKFSLVCIILSLVCIVLTYYEPFLWSNICRCEILWRTSIICFITGIYCVKFIYILRVYIYFKDNDTNYVNVPPSVIIIIISMIISYIGSIFVQFFIVSGECHLNRNDYGCINRFHNSNIYMALGLITIDIILFYLYSKIWINKITIILKNSPKSVENLNKQILNSFKIQLILTSLALSITIIDAILHLIFKKYYVINVFIIDHVTVCLYIIYIISDFIVDYLS